MNKKKQELPWRCPKYPNAKILKTWDETHFVYSDGYPRGNGYKSNIIYSCSICGCELAPPTNSKSCM